MKLPKLIGVTQWVEVPPGQSPASRPVANPRAIPARGCLKQGVASAQAIYEVDFHDLSYGFRLGRSTHRALATVRESCFNHRVTSLLDAEVSQFFDDIDFSHLNCFLDRRVKDGVIRRLIHPPPRIPLDHGGVQVNLGIVEEVERMASYLSPPGAVYCPHKVCANHTNQVPVGIAGAYASFGKTAIGKPHWCCSVCGKTFSRNAKATARQRDHHKEHNGARLEWLLKPLQSDA